ncbi:MAG TPA: hypothetical protein VNH18_19175 [Bryobacteraceae bacterium]|nr:hypothetical protein [Bryobacteraceae bacterium]
MRRIGFSTGALARSDFRRALEMLDAGGVEVVELSALRLEELEPLIEALPSLPIDRYSFVSVHAPSHFPAEMEAWVVERLGVFIARGYPVVVHPNVISTAALWAPLGRMLLIENMDKRKPIGRTVAEMQGVFELLPEAGFCFDVGHSRQVDPSMTGAWELLHGLGSRLREVHLSEVNTFSRHDPVSLNAVAAFRKIARYVPEDVPVILESLIDEGQSSIEIEIGRAEMALIAESAAA